MGLVETVTAQMKDAMKAKAAARLAALRNVRAAFLVEMKKDGSETLEDGVAVGVLRKLAKQRQESIDAFTQAQRPERVAEERAELAVIEEFLPRLADEATTRRWVEEAIAASGASSAKELGKVMGALMKAHKGDVDGDLARTLAAERLAQLS
jgi:uncharacterized protein YqeY